MKKSYIAVFFVISLLTTSWYLYHQPSSEVGRKPASISRSQPVSKTDRLIEKAQEVYLAINSQQSRAQFLTENQLDSREVSGRLLIIADDTDIDHHHHKLDYFVELTDGNLQKVEPLNTDINVNLFAKEVEFQGFELNEKWHGIIKRSNSPYVESEITEIPIEKPKKHKIYKKLVLLYKFINSQETFTDAAEMHDLIFNQAYQNFFLEMSGGAVEHDGDVFGWYTLNREGDDDNSIYPCNISNSEIHQMAAHYNIDLTQYDNITTISNCSEYGTIGGRAILGSYDFLNIGKKQSWIRMGSKPERLLVNPNSTIPGWSGASSILIHERGHNFGLLHSNGLDCGSSQVLYPCSNVEYGNRFDRMGAPDSAVIFNMDQQRRAGFKSENDFLHITESGTYFIDKITANQEGRKIAAYIYRPGTDHRAFMVEHRKAESFDIKLGQWLFQQVPQGVLVYTSLNPSPVTHSPTWGSRFRNIDTNPTELDWHQDTAYESLADSYFDPISGIKIELNSITNDGASINVTYLPEEQICIDQPNIAQMFSSPYITRYMEITQANFHERRDPVDTTHYRKVKIKKNQIALKPGDKFKIGVDSVMPDHMMCPKNWIKLNLDISEDLLNFSAINSGEEIDLGGNDGIHLHPVNNSNLQISTQNYDKEFEFMMMTVPESALGSNYKIKVKGEFGEDISYKEITLYITEDGKLPILPVSPTRK